MTWRLTIAISALFLLTPAGNAATLHVSTLGDGSDGSSWSTAYQSIGTALLNSSTGDDIWVKAGTFLESVTITNQVSLYGGFAGTESLSEFYLRDALANETSIDPNGNGRGIRVLADCDIDGFTVREGVATIGGGVAIEGASVTLSGCKFIDNISTTRFEASGGGIYCIDSTLEMENSFVLNNQSAGLGGGIYARCSIIVMREVDIKNNVAVVTGGGMAGTESNVSLIQCTISGNAAAIANTGKIILPPPPVVETRGGGLALGRTNARLENCLLFKNTDQSGGDQILSIDHELIELENCTVLGQIRRGPGSGGIMRLTNCIARDSLSGSGGVSSPRMVEYSNIEGGDAGVGNIDADPIFVDPENGDFRLQYGSPCIDAGTVTESLTDLDGNARPVDIPDVGVEGPDAFDMGAYEYQFPQSDLNANGYTDPLDLFIFGADWMKVSEASNR